MKFQNEHFWLFVFAVVAAMVESCKLGSGYAIRRNQVFRRELSKSPGQIRTDQDTMIAPAIITQTSKYAIESGDTIDSSSAHTKRGLAVNHL